MTAPSGPIALAQEYLRLTVAACPTFQSWTGAPDAASAANRLYHEALPPPRDTEAAEHTRSELETYRPFGLIWTAEQKGLVLAADAFGPAEYNFQASGELRMLLEQDVPEEIASDPAEIDLRFKNVVGKIMAEMCALAGRPGYLALRRLEIETGPYRFHPDLVEAQGDAQGIVLSVFY